MSNQTVHFKNIREKIIETLETANTEVLIAVAWFTDDRIINVLNDLSQKGIKISILFYEDRINNKDLFKTLYYRKAELKVSKKLMHNKFCIIDREIVINGSYNWTYNATTNDENIQITKYNDDLVNSFVEQFYKLKENCKNFDNHFNYSVERISDLIEDFEYDYKVNFESFKTPYFYKFENLEIHPIHGNKYKVKEGIVIIKDKLQEHDFFMLLYFLKKDIPIIEINRVLKFETKFLQIYDAVEGYNFNGSILRIENERYCLKTIPYNLDSFKKRKDFFCAYIIDSKGETIVKIQDCYKLPSGKFFSNFNIYDENFNLIINNSNSDIVDFIDDFGYVQYKYDRNKNELLYGLFDLKGICIVDYSYRYYNRNVLRSYLYSSFRSFSEQIIENGVLDKKLLFQHNEYIFTLKLYGIISENNELVIKDLNSLNNLIDSRSNIIVFYEFPCLIADNDLLTKEKVVREFYSYNNLDDFKSNAFKDNIYDINNNRIVYGRIHKKKLDNKYFFYSDENFKYKKIYERILSINSKILYTSFIEIIKVYDEGYLDTDDKSKMDKILNYTKNLYKRHVDKYYEDKEKQQKQMHCYVATMVYKDINHPKVEFLRKFRDDRLSKSYFGKIFIKYYYQYSPGLVEKIKDYKRINYITMKVLDLIIKFIK
jgi:hypothetical protein